MKYLGEHDSAVQAVLGQASTSSSKRIGDGATIVGKWAVLDGDTIIDRTTGESIRLRGIDTAETAHSTQKGSYNEVGGQEQKAALVRLIQKNGGDNIRIERNGEDKNNRTIGTLYGEDGTDLNQLMGQEVGVQFNNYFGDDPYFRERNLRSRNPDSAEALSDRYAALKEAGVIDEYHRNLTPRPPKDDRNFATRALARGVDNLQATGGAFLEAAGVELQDLGDSVGVGLGGASLRAYGKEVKDRNIKEASQSKADVASYEDIHSVTDGLKYAAEAVLENLPGLGVDLAVGAAAAAAAPFTGGASLVEGAAAIAARRAFTKGMVAAMYPQMVGESYMGMQQAGVEDSAAAATSLFVTGPINTALERVGIDKLMDAIRFGEKGAVNNVKDVLIEAFKASGKAAPTEGITEVAQSITTELATIAHKPDHQIDRTELLDAFFKGAAAGGGMAGVGRTATATLEYADNRQDNSAIDGGTPTDAVVDENGVPVDTRQFTPETTASAQAQADDLADPNTSREAVVSHPDNAQAVADHLDEVGFDYEQKVDAAGNVATTAEGSPIVTGSNEQNAEALGYTDTLDAAIASGSEVGVQASNPETGDVLKSEMVVKGKEEEVLAKYEREYPNADVKLVTAEEEQATRVQMDKDAQAAIEAAPKPENFVPEKPAPAAAPTEEAPKRVGLAPESERNTESLFTENRQDPFGQTTRSSNFLRPIEETVKGIREGRISAKSVIDAALSLGVFAGKAGKRKKVRIDRFELARSLERAGVYALDSKNGRPASAYDVATSHLTDEELVKLARDNGGHVKLALDMDTAERKKEAANTLFLSGEVDHIEKADGTTLAVSFAPEGFKRTELQKLGLVNKDGRFFPQAILATREAEALRQGLWVMGKSQIGATKAEREAERGMGKLAETETTSLLNLVRSIYHVGNAERKEQEGSKTDSKQGLEPNKRSTTAADEARPASTATKNALLTAKQLAPFLFSMDAKDVETLDDLDGLKLPRKPSVVTEADFTDHELNLAARTLGTKHEINEETHERRALVIRELQVLVKEELTEAAKGRSVVFGDKANDDAVSAVASYAWRAAVDMATLLKVTKDRKLDVGNYLSIIIKSHFNESQSTSNMQQTAAKRVDLKAFTEFANALLNTQQLPLDKKAQEGVKGVPQQRNMASVLNKLAARNSLAAESVPADGTIHAVFAALKGERGSKEKRGLFLADKEYNEVTDAFKPAEKETAHAKGTSNAPSPEGDKEHDHRKILISKLNNATVFDVAPNEDGRPKYHYGMGKRSDPKKGSTASNIERLEGRNLIHGVDANGLPHANGTSGGAVDALVLTEIGQEFTAKSGDRIGSMFRAFMAGFEVYTSDAAYSKDSLVSRPFTLDLGRVTDDTVIGFHPETKEAVTFGFARGYVEMGLDQDPIYNNFDVLTLEEDALALEKELEAAWEAIDLEALNKADQTAINDWFTNALDFASVYTLSEAEIAVNNAVQSATRRINAVIAETKKALAEATTKTERSVLTAKLSFHVSRLDNIKKGLVDKITADGISVSRDRRVLLRNAEKWLSDKIAALQKQAAESDADKNTISELRDIKRALREVKNGNLAFVPDEVIKDSVSELSFYVDGGHIDTGAVISSVETSVAREMLGFYSNVHKLAYAVGFDKESFDRLRNDTKNQNRVARRVAAESVSKLEQLIELRMAIKMAKNDAWQEFRLYDSVIEDEKETDGGELTLGQEDEYVPLSLTSGTTMWNTGEMEADFDPNDPEQLDPLAWTGESGALRIEGEDVAYEDIERDLLPTEVKKQIKARRDAKAPLLPLREALLEAASRTKSTADQQSLLAQVAAIDAIAFKEANDKAKADAEKKAEMERTLPEFLAKVIASVTEPKKDDSRKPNAPTAKPEYGVRTGNKVLDTAINAIMSSVRKSVGLRIPLIVITRSQLAKANIDPKTRAALRKNLQGRSERDSAFVAAGEYGVIVLPDVGSVRERIVTFAHELGHAFIETHIPYMSVKMRLALNDAFKKATKGQPDADFHEWAADQFAHWAIDGMGLTLGTTFGSRDRKIVNVILKGLHNIWDSLKKILKSDANETFMEYLNSVVDLRAKGKTTAERELFQGNRIHNLTGKQVANVVKAKVSQVYKTGRFAGAYRQVWTQLDSIDSKLRKMLYQASQTVTGQASYESEARYLGRKMRGIAEAAFKGIHPKQLDVAWQEIRDGKKSVLSDKVRNVLAQFDTLLRETAVYNPREGFLPEAFSHDQLAKNPQVFFKGLEQHFPDINEAQRKKIYEAILYPTPVNEFTVAPGKAVSQHANVDMLLSNKEFYQYAIKNGLLLTNGAAIIEHFTQTASKRAAWEKVFGGYIDAPAHTPKATFRLRLLQQIHVEVKTDKEAKAELEKRGLEKDGKFYSPIAKFNAEIDRIEQEQGVLAAEKARALVRNAIGLDGSSMPETLRSAQNWLLTYLNTTILAFSGVASLPEIVGGAIRGSNQTSFLDLLSVLRDFKTNKELAEVSGFIMSDMSEYAALESIGADYQSPMQHKIHYWMFKLNGQQSVMRTSRIIAVGLGRIFIRNAARKAAAGDKAALKDLEKLNIPLADAIKWVNSGQKGVVSVERGLSQFVSESVVEPSKFEATTWGNNPYFRLAWHLKSFLYSYYNVMIAGIWRNMGGRWDSKRDEGAGFIRSASYAAVPLLIAAPMLVLLAMGAQELREWIQQYDRTKKMSDAEYGSLLYSKIGALGPLEILVNMKQAHDFGHNTLAGFAPVTSKLDQLLDFGKDGSLSEQEAMTKLRSLTPFFSQNANAWKALFE